MHEGASRARNRIKYRNYGLETTTARIQKLLLHSPFLHGKFYALWHQLDTEDKKRFLRQIKYIIRHTLFGQPFLLAIAKDTLIKDGTVNVTSYVFRYIRTRIYKGKTQSLLTDLQSVLEQEKSDKIVRAGKYKHRYGL